MNEHNPMQLLMQEHDIILKAGPVIRTLATLASSNPETYAEKLDQLLSFFVRYSDQYHHYKEEQVLFQQLRDNPEFMLTDIIEELEDHHESFRDSVRLIREAMEQKNWPQAQQLLEQYFERLQDHIAIENDELFHMTENLFTRAELERMYFLFEDVDRELGLSGKEQLVKDLEGMRIDI